MVHNLVPDFDMFHFNILKDILISHCSVTSKEVRIYVINHILKMETVEYEKIDYLHSTLYTVNLLSVVNILNCH